MVRYSDHIPYFKGSNSSATLYYDEVEIANPLGSKTGKHKLGKFHDYLKNILY